MKAILKRELKSYFTSPIGYIVMTVLVLFSGIYFSQMLSYGYGEMGYVFQGMFTIIFLVTPILTMRLFSEDRRQKTDQAIFTAPVSIIRVVLGKYFATFLFFAICFAPTVVFQLILSAFVSADWLAFLCKLLGVLFLGGALISVGVFVSSLTESQVVSAIGSFAISFFILMLDTLADTFSVKFITKIAEFISFSNRYVSFINAQLDLSNVIFFISFIIIFLACTVAVHDRRRWA